MIYGPWRHGGMQGLYVGGDGFVRRRRIFCPLEVTPITCTACDSMRGNDFSRSIGKKRLKLPLRWLARSNDF